MEPPGFVILTGNELNTVGGWGRWLGKGGRGTNHEEAKKRDRSSDGEWITATRARGLLTQMVLIHTHRPDQPQSVAGQ